MTKFNRDGDMFLPYSETAQNVYDVLPADNYFVKFHPSMGYFLQRANKFEPVVKLYGNVEQRAARILTTFFDRPFQTGVLLAGEKGSGKTLTARQVSIEGYNFNMPTIIINEPHAGEPFMQFLTSINQPTIVLFDEFEKVYSREPNAGVGLELQKSILTLLDGVFPAKKLFILTVNDENKLDIHMINRPGRLFYFMSYKGLSEEFIREYCQDQLVNKDHIESVIRTTRMFGTFNFDMLKSLVEEMNRYKETAAESLSVLNITPMYDYANYEIVAIKTSKGQEIKKDKFSGNDAIRKPLETQEIAVSIRLSDLGFRVKDKGEGGVIRKKAEIQQFIESIANNPEDFTLEGAPEDLVDQWATIIFKLGDIVSQTKDGFLYKNAQGFTMLLEREKTTYTNWRGLTD